MTVIAEGWASRHGRAVQTLVTTTFVVCERLVNDARWRLPVLNSVLPAACKVHGTSSSSIFRQSSVGCEQLLFCGKSKALQLSPWMSVHNFVE